MNARMLGLLAAGLLAQSLPAHAQLASVSLDDVVVGSNIYRATFTQDADGTTTFNQVFGTGSPTLTFTTEADAFAAANAILARASAVDFDFTAGGPSVFGETNGFILPYAYDATTRTNFTGYLNDPRQNPDGVNGPFTGFRTTENLLAWVSFELTGTVPSTPEEALSQLIGEVVQLNLQVGLSSALDSKLQNALYALDRAQAGDTASAAGMLHAFIQSVEAQRGKKLTNAQADQLVTAAQAVIDGLSPP